MIQPRILIKGNFTSKNIEITTNLTSNRAISDDVEKQIETVWEQTVVDAKKNNQLIFDGESFRLDFYSVDADILKLELSKFKYKVRSSLNKLKDELEELGEKYYCNGLAIGGLIKTKENKFIFGKRSGNTITNNLEDFIGGILEPDVIKDAEDLFRCNKQEILEEIGLNENHIISQKLIALVLSPSTNIIMLTYTRLNIDSGDVKNIFEQSNDKFEMAELVFIDEDKLIDHLHKLGSYKVAVAELLKDNPELIE